MATRLVLVVKQAFQLNGKMLEPGSVVTDPGQISFLVQHQPDKVVKTMHECDNPEPVSKEAATPKGALPVPSQKAETAH